MDKTGFQKPKLEQVSLALEAKNQVTMVHDTISQGVIHGNCIGKLQWEEKEDEILPKETPHLWKSGSNTKWNDNMGKSQKVIFQYLEIIYFNFLSVTWNGLFLTGSKIHCTKTKNYFTDI